MSDWYYAQNNQQKGPVSPADLKHLAASGELRPTDLVWRDGMQDWVPASAAKGLFSDGPLPPDGARLRPRRREIDDGYEYPVRRRRLSTGAKVGIAVSIVAGVAMIAGVVVLVILLADTGSFRLTLRPGEQRIQIIEFQGNREATITIVSDVTQPFTDVDLYVFEQSKNFLVASDDGPEKDCRVRFMPRGTQRYRVEIINLGPGSATCRVSHNGKVLTR